jgi:phosphoribosylformimino-5-aminoimidazole carboxamide ribonucleotide (ProFAR) isomerase
VRRLVVSHWTREDLGRLGELRARLDVELQLAGGARSMEDVSAARDAGVDALILGEALFTGAVDFEGATRMLDPEVSAVAARG